MAETFQHGDWRNIGDVNLYRLLGRMVDLSKAHRQLPLRTRHRRLAIFEVVKPRSHEILFYTPTCLGFGSRDERRIG